MSARTSHSSLRLAVALAASLGLQAASAAPYTLHMLPSLGGDASRALAINLRGDVVGWSNDASGSNQPVRWHRGQVEQLAIGPGSAVAINDRDAIVVEQDFRSWLLRPKQPPLALAELAFPRSLNNHGTMAGDTGNGDAALITKTSVVHIVGLPNNFLSYANCVNDYGTVVGESLVDPGLEPTLWKHGQIYQLPVLAKYGSAVAINLHGTIVGVSFDNQARYQAVRWDHMQPIALPAPSQSGVHALNDSGEIVGWAYPRHDESITHAAHWFRDQLTDLNDYVDAPVKAAGWVLVDAWGINANGWIAGEMDNTLTGERRGYLLSK